jgi:hypothetical protein
LSPPFKISLMFVRFQQIISSVLPFLKLLGLGVCLLACSLPLTADTPGMLRHATATGCFCGCPAAKAHGGCVKMCDSKRYASRWWVHTCAKPHMQSPARDSHAGPHFPHPGRAEHAQLRQ